MMRLTGEILVLAIIVSYARPSYPWGDDGHRIVGEIATHYLNPRAAAVVQSALTEADFPSLAEAATWADVYARKVPAYAWANPLHYVNVGARAAQYSGSRDCPDACVVSAIQRFRQALEQPGDDLASRKRRQEALYFVSHFVGDTHQPLHVAHPDGKGGNATEVLFFGETRRAHWVWDEGLIARGIALTPKAIDSAASPTWQDVAFELRMELEPRQVRLYQQELSPEAWATESLALAKRHAYLRHGQTLGAAHVKTTWPVIRRQLQRAGVRLAALLNSTLGARAERP